MTGGPETSLECDYDPYHLFFMDNGHGHDIYKEFYDAEDQANHTGKFSDEDDLEHQEEFEDVPDEMLMDEMDVAGEDSWEGFDDMPEL